MSPIQNTKDMINEIVEKINEYESYADKNNQKIFKYEHDYRILLKKVLEDNEMDDTSCRESENCLNKLLLIIAQISLERIKLVEIKEKINKIIYETNNRKRRQ
uniref:BAG domain-containing protein n=1 Tax=Strongyloides stercoralis TaxID=6248 RepID=A0A0K0ELV8_STRER